MLSLTQLYSNCYLPALDIFIHLEVQLIQIHSEEELVRIKRGYSESVVSYFNWVVFFFFFFPQSKFGFESLFPFFEMITLNIATDSKCHLHVLNK